MNKSLSDDAFLKLDWTVLCSATGLVFLLFCNWSDIPYVFFTARRKVPVWGKGPSACWVSSTTVLSDFFCRAQSGHRLPKQITCPHLSLDSQATAGAGCLPGESLRSDHPANCKCEYRSWWQPGSIAIREADTILLLCFIAGPPAPGASGKWWVARAQALESWASILAPTHAWDCVLGRLIYRG